MNASEALAIIKRGTAEIISEPQLLELLEKSNKSNTPLKIKAGFDPTAPDIHLGHTVLLKKLRQFQDLGHTVFFLIGDFTALIGDPSGQNQMRPEMSPKEIKLNSQTYKKQVFKILNPKKTRIVFNSKWINKLSIGSLMQLVSKVSVSQLVARADFKQRLSEGKEVSLLEFMYPLLQAYDSVFLKADIEIGGIDQKFNLLMARQIQESFNQTPQSVIMMPLLEGTDGVNKMSKSLGNYIGINESASEIFGKTMSISDELMWKFYELLTTFDVAKIKNDLQPMEAKINLAKYLVAENYDKVTAIKAEEQFKKIFSSKELPEDMPIFKIDENNPIAILEILTTTGLIKSGNEGRRLIKQGAVYFNNKRVQSDTEKANQPGIVKVGKRKFIKLV